MDRIGVFTPEQAQLLWQDYQTRQQLAPQLRYNFPQRKEVDEVSPHRVKVKNVSGEVIPAFACMRITGVEEVAGQTCITVEKPTATDGSFLFNSHFEIAVPAGSEQGVGWAFRHGVVTMLGDEPTEPGALFGPIVGSWEIEEGGDKFEVFGRHDFSERALVGRFAGGGTATHTMWFTIQEVVCPDGYEVMQKFLKVVPIYYTGRCGQVPPGQEYDGTWHVYDICQYLGDQVDEELPGTIGRATYMYPYTADDYDAPPCIPVWIIDDLCHQPECS
jgi:hypothetical protein